MLNFNKNICLNNHEEKNVTPNKQIAEFQKFLSQQNLQKESPENSHMRRTSSFYTL